MNKIGEHAFNKVVMEFYTLLQYNEVLAVAMDSWEVEVEEIGMEEDVEEALGINMYMEMEEGAIMGNGAVTKEVGETHMQATWLQKVVAIFARGLNILGKNAGKEKRRIPIGFPSL